MTSSRRLIDRRTALTTLAATGLVITGCTRIDDPPRPTPPPSSTPPPPPLPGTVEEAEQELRLAERAEAIRIRFADRLGRSDRRLLDQLRDAHLTHLAVLRVTDPVHLPDPSPSPDPTSSPDPSQSPESTAPASPRQSGSPTPSPSPPIGRNPDQAFGRLRKLEQEAADHYRDLAADPEGPQDQLGRLALLWGSLAAASTVYADACRHRAAPGAELLGRRRLKVDLPPEETAVQEIVRQCDAMIYGLQPAIAALSGTDRAAAEKRLTSVRILRNRLSAWLADHEHDVPAAVPGYRLPIEPTNARRASRLIITMERRLLPYLGQWLATAGEESDRKYALSALITTARTDLSWSGAITVWPGWLTES